MSRLKKDAIRGGLAKILGQAANTVVRVASLMILARLLSPGDFGLVAMVMTFVGVLTLFKDFGLSTATIQQTSITEGQLSVLFWINVLVGAVLACIALLFAPIIAAFYKEPRLNWITVALAGTFVLNSIGIQHSALLQRQMRFVILTTIETLSLICGVAVGIGMALAGLGYWALVGMTITTPAVYSASVCFASGWTPGLPRRSVGVGSMIRTGGVVTANGLVVYAAYNLDKVLLGRFFGTDALGIYGRGYQLVNIPTETINSAVGAVAMSALSRVKEEPARLKNYFLKGYTLLVSLTLPITAICAVFSEELVVVVLGPRWVEVAAIFRLLTPTILIFGMINPLWPLLVSLGLTGRSLKMALVLAPLVMVGYIIGIPWGIKGVAVGFSITMTLWAIPHIAWSVTGTAISLREILVCIGRPMLAVVVAAAPAATVAMVFLETAPALLRLTVGASVLVFVYAGILLYAMNQKALYLDVIRGIRFQSGQ